MARPTTQMGARYREEPQNTTRGKSTIRGTPRQICDIFGHAPDRTTGGGAFAARCILLRRQHRPVLKVFALCCPLEGKRGALVYEPQPEALAPIREPILNC